MGRFYKGTEDQFKTEVLHEIESAFASSGKYVFTDFEEVTPMSGKSVECLTILIPGEGMFTYPALDLYATIVNDYNASVKDWAKDYVGNIRIDEKELEEEFC